MRTDAAPPGARRAAGRILGALNRFPLKTLLVASVVLVVLFCSLVLLYVQVSRRVTIRAMDSLINVDAVIAELCLKSRAEMTEARRLEKDFLLNVGEFGFDESRSRYVTRLLLAVTGIREHLGRIRGLAGDPRTGGLTREAETALDGYWAGIEAMVAKVGERGLPGSGVLGEMRAEAAAIGAAVRAAGGDALLARYLEVRSAEHDYVEGGRDADLLAHAAASRRFAAAAAALPAAARGEVLDRLGRYEGLFAHYARTTGEILTLRKRYLRSVQAVEPALEELHAAALARVAARRLAIERSTRLLSLPVLGIGGLLLALTAVLALGITVTVTRSVLESRSFAGRIAAGDLGSRLVPQGRNEFAQLATSLNAMAASLEEAAAARERNVEALRQSEERYRALVETSSDWIWAIDLEGRHTYSNYQVRRILGIDPAELLRADLRELLHPEDLPRMLEVLGASVAAGRGWQGVLLRWRHRDGGWRWLESSAAPIRDAQGAVAGFRGIDRDVTERRALEVELAKVQKLEAIGTLAGGIAHDFNNLLQGLFGHLGLARLSLDRPERAAALLDQAEKALALSVNLTTQLLTFAKGGRPVLSRVALPGILEDAARFALSGSRSDFRIVCAPGLSAVDADAGQLSQVFQNLVLNASEAMPQGGTVEIAAADETIEAGTNPLVPGGGAFVRVDVRDAGAGIAAADLARVFDPYFTTKEKGSGLGLATSYSIVRAHHGFIEASSRVGEGSVLSVHLPAAPAAAGVEPPSPSPAPPATARRARILVMDDEAVVRDAASAMLEALGHEAATAGDGEEAVARYEEASAQGRPFDAVVLDLTVRTGMGGEEAMHRLLALDPAVKAVVSSGYSEAAVMADYRAHGFGACLRKPYKLRDLEACLAGLLRPPGAA